MQQMKPESITFKLGDRFQFQKTPGFSNIWSKVKTYFSKHVSPSKLIAKCLLCLDGEKARFQRPELQFLCADCAERGALGEADHFDFCVDKAMVKGAGDFGSKW